MQVLMQDSSNEQNDHTELVKKQVMLVVPWCARGSCICLGIQCPAVLASLLNEMSASSK